MNDGFALNTWLAEDGNHSTAHAIPLSSQARRLGLDATRRCLWPGKVAQPARRVKDKRLRRAFGILDAARWLCFVTVKGLLPTPVKQG